MDLLIGFKLFIFLAFFIISCSCLTLDHNLIRITILQVSSKSMRAKFVPLGFQESYRSNIVLENFEDMQVEVSFLFTLSDLRDDGAYYIETGDVLKPGQRYEIQVYEDITDISGKAIFFTNCEPWKLQCVVESNRYGIWEDCLTQDRLCDYKFDCVNEEDEKRGLRGQCLVTLPSEPTQQTVQVLDFIETPCTDALAKVLRTGKGKAPDCDKYGDFLPLQCEMMKGSFNCECVTSYHGDVIRPIKNFDSFNHFDLAQECIILRDVIRKANEKYS